MTKFEENTTFYVVNTADDGSDAYAVKFGDKAEAEKYLHTEQYNFRERELLTENEFLATWAKTAMSGTTALKDGWKSRLTTGKSSATIKA